MAYVYMPLIFTIIGYGIIYLAISPYMDSLLNIGSVVMVQEMPTFHTQLDSIYKKPAIDANAQPDKISQEVVEWPKFGEQYGEITCNRIQLEAPVYFGDNNDILREGVGQYIGTFLPGYNRLILLAGHNTTYFKPLQHVQKGDVFEFTTSYGVYQYEVTDTKVLNHKDTSAYDLLAEEEMLVMYTCHPFETLVGTKTDSFFVYAKKITGPEVVE